MPAIVAPDVQMNNLLAEAKALEDGAFELVSSETCTAEDVQKSERMLEEASGKKARASQITKIQLSKAAPLPESQHVEQAPTGFKNTKDFWGAVARVVLSKGRIVDPRLKEYNAADFAGADATKSLSAQTGSTGGFLLPSTQQSEVMSVATPMMTIRPGATVIPMSTRSVQIPVLDQTGTTAADHFFGGVVAYWTEEGADMTASDPAFRFAELIARELTAFTEVPNSLLKDAAALAGFLNSPRGFPGAIALAQERAFLKGNGVGKPLGILNSGAIKSVTRNTGSTIKYDDLAKMSAGFLGENPVWIASIAAKETLMLMNGPSGNPSYVWGSAKDGIPNLLMGYPIYFSPLLPAVGTAGDLILVDRSYYIIGDLEEATSLESSEGAKFSQNRTQFRMISRLMGQPWLSKYITLEDGTTTVSPFVVLT